MASSTLCGEMLAAAGIVCVDEVGLWVEEVVVVAVKCIEEAFDGNGFLRTGNFAVKGLLRADFGSVVDS